MRTLYLLSVWLHILAAAVWIGGMIFVALVVVPVIRRPEMRQAAARLIHLTGIRFRWVGWACLGLLLVTGLFNLTFRGIGWAELFSLPFWSASLGRILALKLFVVAWILALSATHDFAIGPRATTAWQENPGSAEASRLRRQATQLARVNMLLALIAVTFGVMLVRGTPW